MAVTIKELAKRAGVSRGTVDRVLHNRPGVRPEVAAHVRKIADEMGFLPNRAGKILAARKQPLKIGCFFPGIGNAFFEDVAKGFHEAQKEYNHYGVSLKIAQVKGFEPKDHIEAIRRLVKQGCKALCLSTMDVAPIQEYVNKLIHSGIPVVTVNTDLSNTKRLCYVGSDYMNGGRTAAGLLERLSIGDARILIVTGSKQMKGHNDRVKGFLQELANRKIRYSILDMIESHDSDQQAYAVTKKCLENNPSVNAIYVAAAGVLGVCRAYDEMNNQCIRIICHDSITPIHQFVKDGIIDFTICQQPFEQGYRSIKILFDYFVEGQKIVPQNFYTKTEIKIAQNIDE